MRYDILLWDVDGTLMDFKRAEAESFEPEPGGSRRNTDGEAVD